MSLDPAAAWLALRTTSAAVHVGSMLELDGYLAGVFVAPSPIAPSHWTAGLLDIDDRVLDDDQRLAAVLGPIAARYDALGAEIEASLERLQADNVCDWRPVFLPADGKPDHAAVRRWAEGFWKAATLDPDGWSAYVDDERTRMVIAPLMTFAPFDHGQNFDPADDIERLLDAAADAIPRSVLLVRMIAKMRGQRPWRRAPAPARIKIGRNEPCPCGSGRKYKRCCGEG